jgi:hypothetical protein
VGAIVAINVLSPHAADLVPVAQERLNAATEGPRLLGPVMGSPLVLNLCAYLIGLVASISNLRTLSAF